ncbi:PREDICTED: uncharacterized protein LOC109332819 isoform X2 [Lupinus angustifolius]|uniref:uncharacterized protein LOC109332819 isoform X2 n=1 Tax=Lupinus angustifolius TaxID=3871 RepID=UPI00092FA79B|nr:PREDICTED: uncharacterized protein LOC109332819 isoform X2 [Lupinus angustifolius]
MKMTNTKVLLLVLCLAICVEMGHPWGEDIVEDAKNVASDAKEKTESFADWAYGKISNFGGNDDQKPITENAKFQTEETASKVTDSVKSTASEATNYATKAAEDAKDKATDAYDQAKDKVGDAYKSTKETVTKGSI